MNLLGEDQLIMQASSQSLVIFLSPHPDDIVFSAYGRWRDALDGGNQVVLMTIFSQSGWTAKQFASGGLTALEISARRLKEELAFTQEYGALLVPLGFRDTSLRGQPDYLAVGASPEDDPCFPAVKCELQTLVQQIPSETTLHIPLGISQHVDHLIVRWVISEMRCGCKQVIFYEDLPYAEALSEEEIKAFVSKVVPGHSLIPALVDLRDLWNAKLKSMMHYESQLEGDTIERIERHARRIAMEEGGLAERGWVVETVTGFE
jgi:deacetylase